ncbi:ACT domain-containing protein [Qipengyuania nanhaisediminis]|uniref:ACT domain-containing protein n=1 Tax=Qipengyuania nanhaisediminis TaxID=604088 RepID=UPI0038B3C5AD
MIPGPVSDLQGMLAGLEPVLAREPYVFLTGLGEQEFAARHEQMFALVYEDEGLTCVLKADGQDKAAQFARITLAVHSDLEAVGLTAAVATRLAELGIACNVIAAFHHDHLFVQWHRREEALAALEKLSDDARR